MREEDARGTGRVGALRKRRATLADGRYLIYFTFDAGEEAPPAGDEPARTGPDSAVHVEPEPPEERHV